MSRVDVVCYTSKHCNLRCRYCYEHPLLADKRRMSLEQIERMFHHLHEYYAQLERPIDMRFQWHGGEPLLIEPEYYWQVFAIQRRVFGGTPHRIKNIVQTNMTVLDDARIALLRDGFDEAGVSLDLYSGLRVNKRGLCMENRSIANLDRARAAGIELSGITVLTRPLLGRIAEVYRFWRDRRIGFRLLPVEKGLYASGQSFEIDAAETLEALRTLADLWLADDDPVSVEPLARQLYLLLHGRSSERHRVERYDKRSWEAVVLVDTDGSVYGYADRFDAARSPGNLFEQPFSALLRSPAHRRAAEDAAERVRAACSRCEHHGRTCTGDPMAEGANAFTEREPDGSPRCVVTKGFIEHLARRLTERGVLDPRTGYLSSAYKQRAQEVRA